MRIRPLICAIGMTGFVQAAPPASNPAVTGTPAVTSTNGSAIDLPVPVGEPVKGIRIPQYDESGKLTMNLSAETARKLDDTRVELEGLKVAFNDKDEKQIVVEIPHSFLDLGTKILTADSQTVITREDFDITGQSAMFDTATRSGSFKGHVKASFRNDASAPVTLP